MFSGEALDQVLATIPADSFDGMLNRRVGLAPLVDPAIAGGSLSAMKFLFASPNRNRFTPAGGPLSLYMGEDEYVAAAETKRKSLLGNFAKEPGEPVGSFWATCDLPNAVLDLTRSENLSALNASDEEIYDPDWRSKALSPSELLGLAAFRSGRFAAIKAWSVRARSVGYAGACYCIFKDRVKKPLRVSASSKNLGFTELWE